MRLELRKASQTKAERLAYPRSEPLELPELPDPDLPELDDCPDAGLCGEIWPLPVPVLPAFVCWLLPVPGPPGWFRVLSSTLPTPVPGMLEPLCWVVDWVPLVCEVDPVWLSRFPCELLPDWAPRFCCCDPVLPDWFSRLVVLPCSVSFAIGLLLKWPPLSPHQRRPVCGGPVYFERTRSGGTRDGMPARRTAVVFSSISDRVHSKKPALRPGPQSREELLRPAGIQHVFSRQPGAA